MHGPWTATERPPPRLNIDTNRAGNAPPEGLPDKPEQAGRRSSQGGRGGEGERVAVMREMGGNSREAPPPPPPPPSTRGTDGRTPRRIPGRYLFLLAANNYCYLKREQNMEDPIPAQRSEDERRLFNPLFIAY